MAGWTTLFSKMAVLNQDHVDTDRIIPARFLSLVTRSGYGDLLFKDVRGADFPLDQPEAKGAEVLLAGTNFGCGSSREHAVWALQQAGFKVVLGRVEPSSPAFSDIFRQNAANCGLLLIDLEPGDFATLRDAGNGAPISVDLSDCTIKSGEASIRFEISESLRESIIHGHDLIGTTMVHESAIREFEVRAPDFLAPASN
jgi:3-isopropylmalate/(R)-2-methylmalate dehydratase small subunit